MADGHPRSVILFSYRKTKTRRWPPQPYSTRRGILRSYGTMWNARFPSNSTVSTFGQPCGKRRRVRCRGVFHHSARSSLPVSMASKTFCITFPKPHIFTTVVASRNRVDTNSQAEILPSVTQELLARPERIGQLYSLSTGQAFSTLLPVPAEGAVDVLRISAILHNNWFGKGSDR